ncbi:hypothetical protein RND71_044003 [Anisodus tanguticus]|uniref:PRP28/DDX23-like helical domain-containing protein n=1 Tax=Anisodus tanguticus TaxID=243964 RepID=A0AAE1UN96_9SOLA|nr:hypothetical protein RND71_044003 [Anisodus tanguticus]
MIKKEFESPVVSKKKEPISLEELKEKLKNEEQEKSKPKFLTKEQRAQEALKRRELEALSQKRKIEEERDKRKKFIDEAKKSYRELEEKERDNRRYERERERRERFKEKEKVVDEDDNPKNKDKEKEVEAIKERYLGALKKKKKVRKLNERKFVFDWDESEDTSLDYNALYKERHTIQLYGRGHVAARNISSTTL